MNAHVQAEGPSPYLFPLVERMLRDLRVPIPSGAAVLDFGTGEGWVVYDLRRRGFQAFGADIVAGSGRVQRRCEAEGLAAAGECLLRTIQAAPYRLPFPDDTFDLVLSFVVFEHVQNWAEALAEIKRVLKPGGACLNFFPARLKPIEDHVFVPFAGVFRSVPYLAFWAFLGIRNAFQRGLGWQEVARLNAAYLATQTCYLTEREIRTQTLRRFGNVAFVEATYLKHTPGRGRYLYEVARVLPFVPWLYRTFHARAVLMRKPVGGMANGCEGKSLTKRR